MIPVNTVCSGRSPSITLLGRGLAAEHGSLDRQGAMLRKSSLTLLALMATLSGCNECDQEVRANPYDETRKCFNTEAQFVGCISKGRSCPPVITVGVDQKGRCFAFPDCLPDGFTRATPGGPCPTENYQFCDATASALPIRPWQSAGRIGRFAPSCVRR